MIATPTTLREAQSRVPTKRQAARAESEILDMLSRPFELIESRQRRRTEAELAEFQRDEGDFDFPWRFLKARLPASCITFDSC